MADHRPGRLSRHRDHPPQSRMGMDEARRFKMALLLLGRNIALAEGGGFLGLGERTSEQEKAALVTIASALRTM